LNSMFDCLCFLFSSYISWSVSSHIL
jgi:hypothetical protein